MRFSVNGIPACAHKKLLTEVVRGEWGFNGYVVSDQGALEAILYNHKYTHNVLDTVMAAINAGKWKLQALALSLFHGFLQVQCDMGTV